MFEYFTNKEELQATRLGSRLATWVIRATITLLVLASVFFLLSDPVYSTGQLDWRDYCWFLAVTSSSIAWGILVLSLWSQYDDTWLYGFLNRMIKAAAIVIGSQMLILAMFVVIALLNYRIRSLKN